MSIHLASFVACSGQNVKALAVATRRRNPLEAKDKLIPVELALILHPYNGQLLPGPEGRIDFQEVQIPTIIEGSS